MEQEELKLKRFLEKQLRLSREQDYILEQMSALLYQMRELAEIAINQQL